MPFARTAGMDEGIKELVMNGYREVGLLFGELREILDHPATDYEVYPRLRVAVQLHERARRAALYPECLRHDSLRPPIEKCMKRDREADELLRALDTVSGKNEQAADANWRMFLDKLETNQVRQSKALESEVLPLLLSRLSVPEEGALLAGRYREAMWKPFEKLLAEVRNG